MIRHLIKSNDSAIKPKWFLRQAGRHIPEYFSIRNKHKDFIEFCFDEDSIIKTNFFYSNYNIKTSINGLKNNNFKKYIPESLKKIIKIFLSKLFPMDFG